MGTRLERLERWITWDDRTLRRGRFAASMCVIYLLFWASYVPINLFSVGRTAYRPFLPGEERIPFVPAFEYLYVLTLFLPVLVVLTVRTFARLLRLMRALGIALLVCYSTYLLLPVRLDRPRLEISSLHTWLLSLQYLDEPYNNLPSLHVTLSWLAVHAAQVTRRTRILLGALAGAISVSTLFVKQHYIVDVVCGYALAWLAWKLGAVGSDAPAGGRRPETGAAG